MDKHRVKVKLDDAAGRAKRQVEEWAGDTKAEVKGEVKDTNLPVALSRPTLEEQIRLRAYELYEAHGWEDGHAVDDWLQAEAEIFGTGQQMAAAA